MKKPEESEQCHINQLPDSVIDNILTCLPIVEAAKDSCLVEKLGTWMDKYLYAGAIHGFTLSIPWLESCAEINPMVQFLSDKKVKHLKIHFTNGDFHVLPSYLFTCLQLSTLDLTGCVLNPPPSFGGFNQLINLYLNEVHITNDFFGMFVSKCPLLENLRLTYCSFREVSNINIFAPNLRTFLYEGCKPFICFISVPLLHQLEFYDYDYNYKGGRRLNCDILKKLHWDEFHSVMPALRKLCVDHSFFKILEVNDLSGQPSQPPNCLHRLKELRVNFICLTDLEDVSSLLGLIKRSPNLERFSAQESEDLEQCRINQLPDNVIDRILVSLPIAEAAKTAVLSRNWKRGWTNLSELDFDYSFGKKFKKAGRANLMLAISRILFLHVGALNAFSLSIPWLESCAEINPLIRFLSDKKIKNLEIRFENGDFHILPSYLFSCSQLQFLILAGCVFNPPPTFGGFSQLKCLRLKEVHINNDFFGMFISNCPALTELILKDCSFSEVSSINIIAPNLGGFCYEGCNPFICFVSAPQLFHLELFDYGYEYKGGRRVNCDRLKKVHLDEFHSSIPDLSELYVDRSFFKTVEVNDRPGQPSQPPNCLLQLEELRVLLICLSDLEDVSILLGLIRRSPNLERFSVQIRKSHIVGHVANGFFNILEPYQYDISCNKLQTMELFDFDGTDPEMEFVKFLLSKSPQLEAMTIHQATKDDQKWLQILKKMIRFQRASAVVDINFCEPEVSPV